MAPTSLLRSTRLLATVAGILALTATAALAKDFCIDRDDTAPSPDFVLRNFALPKKGKCKPILGFANTLTRSAIAGTACGSSDGAHVSFTFTVGFMPGPLEASIPSTGSMLPVNVLLARADLTGLAFSYAGSSPDGSDAVGSECKDLTIP
jgi:hypothetical protein